MYIENIHAKNWEEIRDFFSLDCEAPHLKLFKYGDTSVTEFNLDASNFLGIPRGSISNSPPPFKAYNYRLYVDDRNLIVLGGVGLSRTLLKNRKEARIADKKELIHSALSFLSPFYTMHTDIIITEPSKSYYKSFEEGLSWVFLKQMEADDKITDLRFRVTRDKFAYEDTKIMENVLKEVDAVRNPEEFFKKNNKELDKLVSLPFRINVEEDYENFLKSEPRYVRRLGNRWEYFKPKYQ